MQRSTLSLAGDERKWGADKPLLQPCQSRMATVTNCIVNTVSSLRNAVQGQHQPQFFSHARPKYIPGGYILQHMVLTCVHVLCVIPTIHTNAQRTHRHTKAHSHSFELNLTCRALQVKVGRENLKKPLESANYPGTSYTISNNFNVIEGITTSVQRRENKPYNWQITLDKLHSDENVRPQGNYMAITGDDTHSVPRFGSSELRGDMRNANGPVANFNLADEYRTSTSRGFKFVRGSARSSPPSQATSTLASGTNGNMRIATFHRRASLFVPESSSIDFATRNLTEVCFLLQFNRCVCMYVCTCVSVCVCVPLYTHA